MASLPLVVKFGIVAAVLLVLWSWETVRPFFPPSRDRLRHAARNLGLALGNTLLLTLAFAAALTAVTTITAERGWGLLHQLALPPVVALLAACILHDAWLYVWHRANHTIPFLWRFHRMHHSDRGMDVTTAVRFHLGELSLSALLRLGLVPVLGFELWQLVIYDTAVLVVTMFHHANISLGRADGWLRWLIVTPFMHKVHHSDQPHETNSNYATILSCWDRLAGSYRQRPDPAELRLGLIDFIDPYWQTLSGMLTTPFVAKPAAPPTAAAPGNAHVP